MVYDELDYVVNWLPNNSKEKIGTKISVDSGMEHPLWTVLNIKMNWRAVKPTIRLMTVRAANLLHTNNIPFSFYTNFLTRFNKNYLKTKPLTLLSYKPRKDGTHQILPEYISLFNTAKKHFIEDPDTIRINDKLYLTYPQTYDKGTPTFIQSLTLISTALKTFEPRIVYDTIAQSRTAEDVWVILGKIIPTPIQIDLKLGYESSKTLLLLKDEMKVRTGKEPGAPNPTLNKYFKKDGSLSARGIKAISEGIA